MQRVPICRQYQYPARLILCLPVASAVRATIPPQQNLINLLAILILQTHESRLANIPDDAEILFQLLRIT